MIIKDIRDDNVQDRRSSGFTDNYFTSINTTPIPSESSLLSVFIPKKMGLRRDIEGNNRVVRDHSLTNINEKLN